MEPKKLHKADLEKRKGMFFQIGLVIILAIVLIAFEWTSSNSGTGTLGELGDMVIEEEIIPITRQEEIKPPPPPPQVTEVLNIVEDDVELEDELEMEDTEADENTEIEITDIDDDEETDEIFNFYVLEDKPVFPGGEAALLKYIAKHTRYPEIAKENGITGRVFVQFVINKKGEVTNVELIRGVDPYLDAEALRVVKSLPNWAPGKQRGKPVKVSYQVPIKFKLY